MLNLKWPESRLIEGLRRMRLDIVFQSTNQNDGDWWRQGLTPESQNSLQGWNADASVYIHLQTEC
jgi:hypothetical protein